MKKEEALICFHLIEDCIELIKMEVMADLKVGQPLIDCVKEGLNVLAEYKGE